jgi:hypothetical protein
MSTAEEYKAKADEALAQLADAKSEAERSRLRRAHGAYTKLASHGAEREARAAQPRPGRIRPEKDSTAVQAVARANRGLNPL